MRYKARRVVPCPQYPCDKCEREHCSHKYCPEWKKWVRGRWREVTAPFRKIKKEAERRRKK